jgi:hypothetical protein
MSQELIDAMFVPLSGEEVLALCDGKANILTYPELHKYENIEDILLNGSCIILYEYSNTNGNVFGHYTCVNKLDTGEYEMFDSFGVLPDKERFFIDEAYRRKTNQDYPYLLTLLDRSGKNVSYNHYVFQREDTSTCGRYVGLRILMKHMSLYEFAGMFIGRKFIPDYIVTYLTVAISRKNPNII